MALELAGCTSWGLGLGKRKRYVGHKARRGRSVGSKGVVTSEWCHRCSKKQEMRLEDWIWENQREKKVLLPAELTCYLLTMPAG